MSSSYLAIRGGPTGADLGAWPNPLDPREVQWKLRYAPDTLDRSDQLAAASLIAAYAALINLPQKVRNKRIEQIKRAIHQLPQEEP